ncbi:DNA-directed DNA polymerase [Metamycoplasma arthritidis]|uniref:DNA polymerase III subunit gamma/tau n=1 Tax=Metamycoplasma arthritidis (strain 158L3-1) TaxID=243272 RepID=B3PM34_META1|nr:DNA polymerase III subunit gamma/tau [Metamycoplasma arthritidis]ACF07086.1 DNA polymerase III subunits gamma and tau [Metamycoplasma arthritidis 158L3-1]VEU78614.1 DNA-directed DNA polymerase [Metamycoplasma arthritidis]
MESKYLALYRQYRPNKFDEVKGQENIIRTLTNIIKMQKISHAYLFCGPHGTGKTSVAKIFANTLNCSHSSDLLEPCQECIENIDRNLDIIEIDAASNTGIDDIRELREKIKHLPTHSKYKIYIIDEVHMLSKSAFNALLKTLEEPPKHAIFILATTDPQKIPLTILSRVQRFNFKRIDENVIVMHLMHVYDQEHIDYEKNALKLIASLANGSFRDALSLADQVSIFATNSKITLVEVESLFGLINLKNVIDLINLMASHNIKEVLQKLGKLIDAGADIERLVTQMINVLKDFLVYSRTEDAALLEISDVTDLQTLKISIDKTYEFISELVNLLKELKYSDLPLQTLELGFIKMATLKTHDENFVNEIVMPKAKEISPQTTPMKDFEIDVEPNSPTPKKRMSQNVEKINSIFDLSSIANKDIEVKEISVDEVLEKTSELVLKEKTQEFEMADVENDILSLDSSQTSDFEINENFEETTNPPELDFDLILDCLAITQKLKIHEKENNMTHRRTIDKISYAMLETKLSKPEQTESKEILKDLEILASADDFILFSSPIDEKVFALNRNAYKFSLVNDAKLLFGRYVHLFAVTSKQNAEIKAYWKAHSATIMKRVPRQFEKLADKYDLASKSAENLGKEIFGDKFSIEEGN